MMQLRSYKVRLRPSAAQAASLDELLVDFCGLYNACLQQRQEAWQRRGASLHHAQQAAELKAAREAEPTLARWSFTAHQQVLRRVETTYAAFLSLIHI